MREFWCTLHKFQADAWLEEIAGSPTLWTAGPDDQELIAVVRAAIPETAAEVYLTRGPGAKAGSRGEDSVKVFLVEPRTITLHTVKVFVNATYTYQAAT